MSATDGMSIGPGDVIDRKYQIVRLIGEGGMGAVFEGTNTFIKRRVAIKVLLSAAKEAGNGVLERFEREAQAAGCIGSDHILEVLDLGSLPNGDRYMVMEYLDGESLADRIRRVGKMPPHEVAPLIRQALVGLDAAHAAGIVHRDLKPDNIYVLREKAGHKDFVKIIDFGISKFNALSGDMSMTRTGAVMGTPYYMSPEQAKGAGGVNHQSDLYSMGVIAFEALTGRVPFEGTTFNDLMFKIVLSDMPSLEEAVPGIDRGFAEIVKCAMARDTSARYKSAKEFIAAIDDWTPHARTAINGTPIVVNDAMIAAGRQNASSLASATTSTGLGANAAVDTAAADTAAIDTNFDMAASQADVALSVPTKKQPVMLYAGIGAVVLLAGGAFALSGGGSESAAGQPALEPHVVEAAAPPSPVTPSAPAATPPAATPAAATTPPAPTAPADSAAPAVQPTALAPAQAAKPSAPVVAKPAAKPAAAPAKPAPTAEPAAAPKPVPAKPKAGPDFGY